ncbi:hypothetical protein K438DRAFT_1767212 [Mycena galopus ATCC 62051]|nr:hypothetical protein K438DRAFT_1767212 [Mycena galopus ATCC 62051]
MATHSKLTRSTYETLWERYKKSQAHDSFRREEHDAQALSYRGRTMRYVSFTLGSDKPADGYPLYIALHGGGSVPSEFNNQQWEHMKIYYRNSVRTGIYVAPRGVTDTWDLHFQPESYVLIKNMILYEDADPDRGDGVYQLTPRLADRFAAANMSAGHPNGVNLANLASLPLLLQVGENDIAYNRNTATAEYNNKLDALTGSGGGYPHKAFIHAGCPHNFFDNDPAEQLQYVLSNAAGWLVGSDRCMMLANTNAVRWVDQHIRDPLPAFLVWDLTTRAERESGGLWYWLDIGGHTCETLGTDTIVASYVSESNIVVVEQARKYLRILLNHSMLNLDKPVVVKVVNKPLKFMPLPANACRRRRSGNAETSDIYSRRASLCWKSENRDLDESELFGVKNGLTSNTEKHYHLGY